MDFFRKIEELEKIYEGLETKLGDPDVVANREVYQKLAKEHSELSDVVLIYRRFKAIERQIVESRELLKDEDPDMRNLAAEELETLKAKKEDLETRLSILLKPKDPNDEKNVFLEIRAGTGGEEAGLFAADLFRMYSRYAEEMGWKIDILSHHQTGTGGLREIIALIEGKAVYSRLKHESGVHRVQRVPTTETQGRIHTSAVTVAVLPEAEDVEVEIKPEDLRIDVFRSSGPGGQHVNTTDSAVRITHIPTGLVVAIQDEKSQHKNKAKAMKVLRARLKEQMEIEQQEKISADRKSQVGSGDRSERIRTYNFPQNRVTDHRINLTLYRLEQLMEGDLASLLDPLLADQQFNEKKMMV